MPPVIPWQRTPRRRQRARMSTPRFLRVIALCSALFPSLPAWQSNAAPPPGMPVMDPSEVRPGQKGVAWTVFFGTQSEPFEVELIDVVPDFRTGMPIVLFRALDPRLEHSGIVAGMSGSPVYVDGKLLGAVSYGFPMNKDPIGGITPVVAMLEIDKLPYRPTVLPVSATRSSNQQATAAEKLLGIGTPLVERITPWQATDPSASLAPIGASIQVGQMHSQAAMMLQSSIQLPVVRGTAGSSGGTSKAPKKGPAKATKPSKRSWRGGDSVSVVFLAGDNSAAANGTVTWVGGKSGERLLAFGHPMDGAGASQLPIADAHVHVIIPSIQKAFKLSTPQTVQGTMVQDRQPAIAIRTDVVPPQIAVATDIQGPDPKLPPRHYDNQVALHQLASAGLIAGPLLDGLEEASGDTTEITVEVEHVINYSTKSGPKQLHLTEEFFFEHGLDFRIIGGGRSFTILRAMFNNPYELVNVRDVTQRARVHYGAPVDRIESMRLINEDVYAGELAHLEIQFRGLRDELRTQQLDIRIPLEAGDQSVVIEIAAGEAVAPERPAAKNVDDLIETLEAHYPDRSVVASVYLAREGLSTTHGLLNNLPPSVLESLSPGGSTNSAVRFKARTRRVIPHPTIVFGTQTLEVEVLPPRYNSGGKR